MLMLFTRLRSSMKVVVIVVSVAFVATLLVYGTSSRRNADSTTSEAIAKVGDESISRDEFMRSYYNYAQYQEQNQGPIPGDSVLQIKAAMLDQMVDRAVLVKAAKDAKTKVDKKAVDKEFDRIKNQFPTKDAFAEALTQNNFTEKSLRENLMEGKLLEIFEANTRKGMKVSAKEIAEAYEQVKASHILIGIDAKTKDADAKATAEKVLAEVKTGGDFATLAKKYSTDSGTKEGGGDLGFFARGKMVPAFDKAAFSMKVGDISDIVKTKFGYHIIKVTERKDAKGKEFDKAVKALKKTILDGKWTKWVAARKKAADVEITDAEINGYKLATAKKFDAALMEYGKASEADPNNAYIYVNQGRIYMEKKDLKNALLLFQKATEVNESDATIRMVLGNAYKENKQVDKAIIEYKRASDLAPTDFYLHFGLLTTFQQLGEKEAAAAEEAKLQTIYVQMEEQRKAQAAQQEALAAQQKAAEEAAKKAAAEKKAGGTVKK